MKLEEHSSDAGQPVLPGLEERRLQQLAEAVEQSPVSIVITDTRGAIEYVNRKFTEITGYTREEAMGKNPRILKSGAQSLEVYRDLWATILGGREWRGEFHNRKKNGELYWESVSISPLRGADGKITHFLAVKEDVNHRKQQEEALQQFNDALEEAITRAQEMTVKAEMASIAKSQFLAHMSHEIRTPMNGVIGMTGLLLDTGLSDVQRSYAEIIRSSAEALLSIINDILDFSKIEARKLELETIAFDLPATLENTTDLLAPRAHAKGIELVCAISPDVPASLRGDPGRLRQIIVNLIGNALKFTSAGEVVLRVRREANQPGRVQLRFEISDTGIGIPPEKIERLFNAFTQVDGSHTRKFGGTGLGLAISKQLVELMGGKIGVISQPGQGSTFWFSVSFEQQILPANEGPATTQGLLRATRILVVDDNTTARRCLADWLVAQGARVMEAADGPAALLALQAVPATDPFHLAVVDRQMPEMDGATLVHRLQANGPGGRVPVVLLTSPGAPVAPTDLPKLELAGEFPKPVHPKLLLPGLLKALGRPVEAVERPAAAPPRPAETVTGRKPRVLVADDNATNRLVAIAILRKLGVEADVASDGRKALQSVQTRRYELVLMDCLMPEMDGYEATQCIRKLETESGLRRVPIVAMTADTLDGAREACLAAGMDDYIAKPVSQVELAAILGKWLGRERANGSESTPKAEAVGEGPSPGGGSSRRPNGSTVLPPAGATWSAASSPSAERWRTGSVAGPRPGDADETNHRLNLAHL